MSQDLDFFFQSAELILVGYAILPAGVIPGKHAPPPPAAGRWLSKHAHWMILCLIAPIFTPFGHLNTHR